MPIYEYRCEACETCFEMIVFSSDSRPVACPSCGTTEVRRQMSCTSAINASESDNCGPGRFS